MVIMDLKVIIISFEIDVLFLFVVETRRKMKCYSSILKGYIYAFKERSDVEVYAELRRSTKAYSEK